MHHLQSHIAAVALLAALFAALTGAVSAAEPAGDTLLFVPPVRGEQADRLIDPGTQCIALHRVRSTRIIAGEGIVYQMTGRRALINRPTHGGKRLQRHQVLITRTHGTLLCAGDIVHLADGMPGMTSGFVALGRFQTYQASVSQ
jgi:hypothetical protein